MSCSKKKNNKMFSIQSLSDFIEEKLTTAALEIFHFVRKSIVEHEEELEHRRKLLDIALNPHVHLKRIDVQQQHACKEEQVQADPQLCNRERNSSADREPPRIIEDQEECDSFKEEEKLTLKQETDTKNLPQQLVCKEQEVQTDLQFWNQEMNSSLDQEELCSFQRGEQLELKQETDTFLIAPIHEEGESGEPEPQNEQQLLSRDSHVPKNRDTEVSKHKDSEPKQKKKLGKRQHQNTEAPETGCDSHKGQKRFRSVKNRLQTHQHAHPGREAHTCETCGATFRYKASLALHIGSHTELPQEHVYKEVVVDEQLCNQERNSSPDREEPRIKQEPEEPCSSRDGEQLILKQETEALMWVPAYEESDNGEPEQQHEHLFLSYNSHAAENQDPHRSKQPCPPNIIHQSSHNTDLLKNQCNPHQDQQSYKCDTCDEIFRSKSALRTHQRVHTGKKTHSCKICGKMFSFKSLLTVHVRSHTGERPFSCKTCGKRFCQISVLKKHYRIHTDENPYKCKICGRSCRDNHDLKVHMRTHTGEKPYSCNTCGKTFGQISNLYSHIRSHTEEKQFICDICGKSCRDNHDLKVHMRTHTGEKPFSCNTCGKRFYRISHLNSHMKTHTSERLYTCTTCGKSFCQMSVLRKHIRNHEKPLSCNTCGRPCRDNHDLKVHMRTHTGERPYSCNTCGRTFRQISNLYSHIVVHTEEKPYACDTCGERFSQVSVLKQHTLIHADENQFLLETQ
ncbi:zinc finger protein 436-like isoform X1 [Cheilinus undulatus]|uniref:zinc finger protein 436-like isoform X1 n=1 Tax=Cheilinus undulatus TaxID=241271 RepID=UPI001BD2CBAD|nr:zinc finger protein 436-like isoform X1 [Cheilinus undulatus]